MSYHNIFARLASISPVLSAASSYFINFIAAVLSAPSEYASYIELQAWAVYFGAVSSLCLIDLKLSPNASSYKSFRLLGLSILISLFLTLLLILYGLMLNVFWFYFFVSILGFLYGVFRGILMCGLVMKIPGIPVYLRITRGIGLILFGVLVSFIIDNPSSEVFIFIQLIAVLLPLIIVFPKIYRLAFPFDSLWKDVKLIFNLDKSRLLRRNISYVIDMTHVPIFFTCISKVSENEALSWAVYLSGLLLPIAFLINQIISERMRYLFGLGSIELIGDKFSSHIGKFRRVHILFRLLYIFFAVVTFFTFQGYLDHSISIVIAILILISFSCVASFYGIIFAKSGMDMAGLIINFFIACFLIISLILVYDPAELVIVVSFVMCSKYMIYQLISVAKLSSVGKKIV